MSEYRGVLKVDMRKITPISRLRKAGAAKPGSRRPKVLVNLFTDGGPYDGWGSHNWKHRRFYVLNLKYVMGALRLSHTASERYFDAARKEIKVNTKWPEQFGGDYSCSKVQIYPKNADGPKLLDKAAAIIVALEIASLELHSLNVYDYLRIVPAYYFLDGLNRRRLEDLRRHYQERSDSASPSFEAVCSRAIGQSSAAILTELAQGFCATRSMVETISEFVRRDFPKELSVGAVRVAGDSSAEGLGTRDAAPSLHAQQRGLVEVGPIRDEASEFS